MASEVQTVEACANCGKESSDAVKLKNCTACRLVKYCSVDCQKSHRKQHKKACKQRAAELRPTLTVRVAQRTALFRYKSSVAPAKALR